MSHDSCGGFCFNTLLDSELLAIERDSAPLRAKGVPLLPMWKVKWSLGLDEMM
jgi:hypothetical protein